MNVVVLDLGWRFQARGILPVLIFIRELWKVDMIGTSPQASELNAMILPTILTSGVNILIRELWKVDIIRTSL